MIDLQLFALLLCLSFSDPDRKQNKQGATNCKTISYTLLTPCYMSVF